MSLNRKPGAVAETAGGSQDPQTGVQRTLVSLLEMAFGDVHTAHTAVASALVVAGRDELPREPAEMVAFVRAHLLTPLSDQIGPRLTMALVDDLLVRLDLPSSAIVEEPPPSSVPRPIARIAARAAASTSASSGSSPAIPSSRVRKATLGVVLVDADRVGRTGVARALLRAHWDVTVVESTEELRSLLDVGEPVDVALVDAAHPSAPALFEAIGRAHPGIVVVARSADAIRTRAHLTELGVERFDVRSREAPAEELIDAIKRAREP
ncbi:MAG TPA: hypothetical protein VIY73_00415 [Polyangiaceae bacterium]